MPHRFLKRIDVRLTFTWLYCDPPPSQVASSDLRVLAVDLCSPLSTGGFPWLSPYLIAAFGNVALIGIGNAWMTLKLFLRLGSPKTSNRLEKQPFRIVSNACAALPDPIKRKLFCRYLSRSAFN